VKAYTHPEADVRTTHDSPSRVDWAPLSDHDEQALEAIRRQLDMEFPHFSGSVAVTPAAERPAPRRRGRAATALGLLLACAGGFLATVFFITLYQTLKSPPAGDRHAAPTAPAPMTLVVAATPPAATVRADTSTNPPPATTVLAEPSTKPPRSERATATAPRLRRANSTPARPVPDVVRVTEPVPPRREAAAVAPVAARAVASPPPVAALPPVAAPPPVTTPPPVAAPPVTAPPPVTASPPVAAPPPVTASPVTAPPVVAVTPLPVTTPQPVQPITRTAPAPTTLQQRPLAERARDTLMQTSEQVRNAWETVRQRVVRSPAWEIVKERVGRSPGEISAPPRGGADAP
jgi:hypothetical protein